MAIYQFMNKLKMIWDRRLEPTTQPPLAEPSSFVNIKPVIPTICHNIYNVKNQHTNLLWRNKLHKEIESINNLCSDKSRIIQEVKDKNITSLNSLACGSMFKPVVPSRTCRISCIFLKEKYWAHIQNMVSQDKM